MKKKDLEPVEQADTFSLTDQREELIERVNEDPPVEPEGMLENEPEVESEPDVEQEPDTAIPEIEPEPVITDKFDETARTNAVSILTRFKYPLFLRKIK